MRVMPFEAMIGQLPIRMPNNEPERHAAGEGHIHDERDGLGFLVADDVHRLRHEGRRGKHRGNG